MDALTARERDTLRVIQDHLAAHGYPPSVRDVATGLGLRSPASAFAHLEALERKGRVRRHAQRSRAIAVVREV